MIEEGATCVQLSFHQGQHIVDCGELDDGLAKLLAICGVSQAFVVGRLRDTYALGCDAEACAVHQSHHVFNQAEFAVATKLCVRIFVDEFAGGRAVNTQFVLYAAHIHTALALVVDKH